MHFANLSKRVGLFLRSSPAKKKLKITSIDYHKVFHKKLPVRKKWKKFVSPTNININEDKVRKKELLKNTLELLFPAYNAEIITIYIAVNNNFDFYFDFFSFDRNYLYKNTHSLILLWTRPRKNFTILTQNH